MGLFLFYALAGQPAEHVWPIVLGLGLFGALVGFYFLLTRDWSVLPAKVENLNQAALRWSDLRPAFLSGVHALHPNVAGGLMAMTAPLLLGAGIRAGRKTRVVCCGHSGCRQRYPVNRSHVTTSRGAWLALGGGLIAWLLWLAARPLGHRLFLSRRLALALSC